jgi:hypothetical protein
MIRAYRSTLEATRITGRMVQGPVEDSPELWAIRLEGFGQDRCPRSCVAGQQDPGSLDGGRP